MKHNKYFKTQLAACAAIAFVSCYSFPPRCVLSPRGNDIKSFVIACQRRRKNHK